MVFNLLYFHFDLPIQVILNLKCVNVTSLAASSLVGTSRTFSTLKLFSEPLLPLFLLLIEIFGPLSRNLKFGNMSLVSESYTPLEYISPTVEGN